MSINFNNGIHLDNNAMLKVKPELFYEWDFEKNDKLGIDIYKVTKGSSKKVWWICSKCDSSYDTTITNRTNGKRCPYCASRKVNNTNSLYTKDKEMSSQWNIVKNKGMPTTKVLYGGASKHWWICELGHEWKASIDNRKKGHGCPYCSKYNAKLLVGINDMWTTAPELAELLLNPNDGYKYKYRSNIKLDWTCQICKRIVRNLSPGEVGYKGVYCVRCSRNISLGEKFIYALLNNKGLNFKREKSFEWSDNKRYDFYLYDYNTIIEVHGAQHYSEGSGAWKSLASIQNNDEYKHKLANINGINNYIVIDARRSEFTYIRNSILESPLINLLNITIDDLNSINYKEVDTIFTDIWVLREKGKSVTEIATELDLSNSTVVKYLKIGNELGYCEYIVEEELEKAIIKRKLKLSRKVVKLDKDNNFIECFDSVEDAGRSINNKSGTAIYKYCRGLRESSNGFKWMYKDEYDKLITFDDNINT